LQGLTNKVIEFRGGNLKEYDGDIYEFLRIKNLDSLKQLEKKDAPKDEGGGMRDEGKKEEKSAEPKAAQKLASEQRAPEQVASEQLSTQHSTPNTPSAPSLDREERKRLQREERRVQRQIEECEAQIAALEADIARADEAMSAPDFYTAPNLKETLAAHEAERKQLDAKMEQWSALQEELATFTSVLV
jgi:ATP-binding cassette subfamily F protein 3